MLIVIYHQISERVFSFASGIKVYQLVLLATVLTVICYFPDINQYKHYGNLYHSIDQEINAPLDNASYTDTGATEFNMHTEKRKFRLLIPVIANILQADARKMIWLQFLLLPVFILVMYRVFRKISNDHITSVLLTLALPFFYVSESFLWVMPIYDSYGYLLLALLFLTYNNLLRYLILVAVCFSDERAIISSFLVFTGLQLYEHKTLSLKKMVSLNRLTIAFALGWLTYLTGRYLLTVCFNISIPISSSHGNGIFVLISNYGIAPLGIFLTFEGFWILILPAILILLFEKRWFESIVITGALLAFFSINLMVFDITRSFGYCYTFIFTALLLLARSEQSATLRHIGLLTAIGCIITPTMLIYCQHGNTSISWLSPVVPKIFHFF